MGGGGERDAHLAVAQVFGSLRLHPLLLLSAAEAPCAAARSPRQFQLRKRPVRTDTLSVQTAGLRLHLSPWVPRLQTASFSPPYSPTVRSPPTDCRRTSASGTGAPCRMRFPKCDASRNRSRWDWRKSPHFRVRMARPRTTPCQVNISKRVHAPPGVDPQPSPLVRFVSVVSRKKEKAQEERTRWSSGRGCWGETVTGRASGVTLRLLLSLQLVTSPQKHEKRWT